MPFRKRKNTSHEGPEAGKPLALDDESRVQVLSPSMLVLKRFFRNRLALAGLIIIVAMFLFSFLGGALHPYSETQIFYKQEERSKTYASATHNDNFYYTTVEGESFSSTAQAGLVLALNSQETTFTAGGEQYAFVTEGQDFHRIQRYTPVAMVMNRGSQFLFSAEDGFDLTEELQAALTTALEAGQESVDIDGSTYHLIQSGKSINVTLLKDVAIASKQIFDLYHEGDTADYNFKYAAEKALCDRKSEFTVDDVRYTLSVDENDAVTVSRLDSDGNAAPYANLSDIIVTPSSPEIFLTIPFKQMVAEALDGGLTSFVMEDSEGNPVEYRVDRKDHQYNISTDTVTQLIDTYASPSMSHWLGTDGFGMDLLARLMYGGRVSLIIGFIVVLIETAIGVVLGGVAGYFGGWVDNLLMWLVDIFNCIPTMPLFIILGAMMDALKVDPTVRIYYLMLIFGLTGWPSIARVVRGQILSLREQEFMTATEATGLTVSRRIFRHLIPNVVPQLIVYATMGLGSIILSEATLSFLGLGVKFPYASWGNIVTAVNDSYVLTNYWFVWIPAGFLILITVLGFNFVGDGLRDAFDPKMKR